MRISFINKTNATKHVAGYQNLLIVLGRIAITFLLLFMFQHKAKAQQTYSFTEPARSLNTALDLYQKEKYAAALTHFDAFVKTGEPAEQRAMARYYAAVCALELFNGDAETRLKDFMRDYPENTLSRLALYQLGKWYYRNKNNKLAVNTLDKVESAYLEGNELKEYYFIYGYSLFKAERFEDAKTKLKPIVDEKSKYYDAANYYYGYVCYRSASYDEALEHFGRIKYHKTFGPLSMVYVAQVYFARKQYRDVINFCDTLSNAEVANDVAGMEGQSHYMLQEYKEAIPHLEKFMAAAPVIPQNSDYYMLGFSYQKNQQFDKAIEQYLKIETSKDSAGKLAFFNMGKCYLALNNKTAARAAFESCYQLDSNSKMAEPSLFLSAKLSDDLNLQGMALTKYVRYIDRFPDGPSSEEARTNLGNLLLNTRNYKESIRILESIKKPATSDLTNLQRVRYYRAEELLLNNQNTDAAELLNKVSNDNHDARLAALADFWLAEIAFKENDFNKALKSVQSYQEKTTEKKGRLYEQSWYNLGYYWLKLENYNKAIEAFQHYMILDAKAGSPEMYTDALLRTADCFFAVKNYEKAIENYQLLVSKSLNGADYALYQKAMILGVLNRNEEKISALKTLEKNYPKSPYIDDAVYELADIYLKLEEYNTAIQAFQSIITNYPRSVYLRKAMLNKSLCLFNMKRDDEALEEIKKLITNYPGSDEARQALPMVQNIFVNQGNAEKYLDFIKVLPNVTISASTQDSLSYESAFNNYQKENFEKASKGFGTYISRFPGGYFILKANYFKAESDYKLKKYDDALTCYLYVADAIRSEYSEKATRQSAVLLNVQKKYDKAYEYFAALERIAGNRDNLQVALLGQMRTCANLLRADSAAAASFRYLNSGVTLKEGIIEANTYIGRYYINHQMPDSALVHYQTVLKEAKNGHVFGAEAKYNIAYIQYLKKDYKGSQKTIFELNDKFSAFEYWVAKGFLLLADDYIKLNDLFQAKATLQSLIDNYDGKEIIDQCKVKLSEIAEMEKSQKSDARKQIEQRINQSEK